MYGVSGGSTVAFLETSTLDLEVAEALPVGRTPRARVDPDTLLAADVADVSVGSLRDRTCAALVSLSSAVPAGGVAARGPRPRWYRCQGRGLRGRCCPAYVSFRPRSRRPHSPGWGGSCQSVFLFHDLGWSSSPRVDGDLLSQHCGWRRRVSPCLSRDRPAQGIPSYLAHCG